MEILRNVYKNKKFEGLYKLVKYQGIYSWKLERYFYNGDYPRLDVYRSVDIIKYPYRCFPFEEGDI